MAEYSANASQVVASNQPVIFTESPVPSKGLIFHRDESGIFRLASPSLIDPYGVYGSTRSCCCNTPEAMYLISFHANIALPTGATPGPISLAIAIDGEIDPSSTMISTPAAAEAFDNVGAEIIVAVPFICRCSSISVRNTSSVDITVQNANLVISYQGIR